MRALALFALLVVCGPAAAFEPTGNAVADTFLSAVERAGFADARVDNVAREGGDTLITGLTAGGTASGKGLAIARTRISEPLVNADNDLAASAIGYEGVEIRDGAGKPTSSIDSLRLADVRLPGGGATEDDVSGLLGKFDTLEIAGLTARSEADEEIKLKSLQADLTGGDKDGISGGSIAFDGLVFDLSLLEEPTKSQVEALGYKALEVGFRGAGEWEAASGRAVLDNARLSIAGMGAVELQAGASGLTAETYEALKAGGLDFARLLEVLGTVSLTGLTVTLEDDGLTNRLLDQLAAGSDRASVITQLLQALAAPLTALGDPAFAKEALEAVRGFLNEPGRLTVAATPGADVTALQVIGAAMLNPKLIPSLLSLKISRQ